MQASEFYYVAVGIQAIFITIFVAVLTVFLIYLITSVSKARGRFMEAATESRDAAEEAREYVGKIGSTIVDYLIIKISDSIKKNK
jgi:5-bromo-4-chloroindolyl phosphate hydrolysis protein